MCCLLTWISDPQKESKTIMSVYSYTILMPPIFYHLKTRYFVKNRLKSFVFVHRKSKMATAAGQMKKSNSSQKLDT
jgi:hypothetical protein